ncbi:GerAB/ArcD/ProY family transporter [Paenibacillus farraposensis]|uniref:GerAB/ArcD/ProY family transporter n=1 Tax=Paenibacillus farraposensis TaxID=2807095 RepID=A0ABW4DBM1_9BACL|nr:GerAB/ArcD/ProY family transporter [Paenibacillus farraposensis]MCC3381532.1 GerAB/ArcD/ProY family transporter [Paenibacillus farraposensis]
MKKVKAEKLTTLQTVGVLTCAILASGLLSLPRTAVEESRTADAWISVLIGGAIAFVAGWIMAKMSQKYPNMTFYQYVQKITGKAVGKVIGLLIVVYFIALAGYETRSVEEITSFFLLEGTPAWAISAPFIWVSLYLCMGGIMAIGRMCQIILPISAFIFVLICLLSLNVFELNHLRPVLAEGVMPVFKALKSTTPTFTGSECLLIITCFMEKPEKATKVVAWGTGIATLFYVTTVFLCIGVFTVEGVVTRTWPFIDLARCFEVDFLVLERFESLLLSIWIMQIFATFSIALYIASVGISQILNVSYSKTLFILIPLIYVLSQIPTNLNEVFSFGGMVGNGAIVLFGILPLPLLLISRWRGGNQ